MAKTLFSSRSPVSSSSLTLRPLSPSHGFRQGLFGQPLPCRKLRNISTTTQAAVPPIVCQNASSSIKSFELIESLLNRVTLSEAEAEASLDFLLSGANAALISAVLILLKAKRETFEEVVGLASSMIKHAHKVGGLVDAVDIVGTGGNGANTVNISTGASILAAACGAKVAKETLQLL